MNDFYEIDFLNVESSKSGDAIPLRYRIEGKTRIHVTDGGFDSTGDSLIEHINTYYNNPDILDAIIVTHPDGDHAAGLRKLFEEYQIKELWMLRPWMYAEEIIDSFSRISSVDNLSKTLKEAYPNILALEELAQEYDVPIFEPFRGKNIGQFTVLAPSKKKYLDYVIESDKTPESIKKTKESFFPAGRSIVSEFAHKGIKLIKALWGEESFPEEDTSSENNMSIIQYANLCDRKIILTADAGRSALEEAADFAPNVGLYLPGIDTIQIPHHGSRHNVNTELLDLWLGPILSKKPDEGKGKFSAIVSASKNDEDHPRKSVIRAFIHRGAEVITTENASCLRTSKNAPNRPGWGPAQAVPYPQEQEQVQ